MCFKKQTKLTKHNKQLKWIPPIGDGLQAKSMSQCVVLK